MPAEQAARRLDSKGWRFKLRRMGAVPFDTLKLARRLEGAGFPPKHAGDIAEAGSGLRAEILAVQAELKAEIELLRRDLTIRFGSMLVVAVGIILAAIRYLPPPHP